MSEVKVNKISPRTNCGTVTLGDSGDTFTIPAGVSITNNGTASGFGATGAASWNTTVKTADFTAVAGEGYFVDTTSGAINVTLPAGTAGAVVAIKDYAGTFDTNAVTLIRNGSDKVGGIASNPSLNTEGIAVTLVFVDSTQGWLVTDDGLQSRAATYITATGGTITTVCTNFKVHTFTSPGTFTVTGGGGPLAKVDYMVIGGGGGGGAVIAGGGGAGGFRESKTSSVSGCWTASPLVAACASLGPFSSPTAIPVTVGAGGAGTTPPAGHAGPGSCGSASTFSTITAAGGGKSCTGGPGCVPGVGGTGGSGGGGARRSKAGGAGNTPTVSPPQGNPGGSGGGPGYAPDNEGSAGGGGGAGATGSNGAPPNNGGAGGAGVTTNINSAGPTTYAGGGGGGTYQGTAGAGGSGGGGRGGPGSPPGAGAVDGTANTGGGGGGSGYPCQTTDGGTGGSGIVIIRYRFQ